MNETREPEAPRPETARASIKLRVGMVLVCALAVVGTLGVASHLWLEGHVPLVAYLFGFFLPTLIITALLSLAFDPEHDEAVGQESAAPRARVRASALALAAPGLLGALACALWLSEDARAHAALTLHAMGDEDALVLCSGDPSNHVALQCCERAPAADRPRGQASNASRMQFDPSSEHACFVSSIDGTSPHASGIARMLTNRWERALVEGHEGATPEQTCAVAANLASMDRVAGANVPIRLAHCALTSPNHAARQCCAGELRALTSGDGDLTTALPPPDNLARTEFASLAPTLLEHALPSHDPARAETLGARAAAVGLDRPGARAWTIQLACEVLGARQDRLRDDVITRLNIGLSAAACGLPEDPLSATRLEQACLSWLDTLVAQEQPDPPQAMCLAARDGLLGDAHRNAGTRIQRALAYARAETRSGPAPALDVMDLSERIGPVAPVREKPKKTDTTRTTFARYQEILGELQGMKRDLKAHPNSTKRSEAAFERLEGIQKELP
jgi:hypothetical protein